MKLNSIILQISTTLALGMLFFLGLNQCFGWIKIHDENSENRTIAQFPKLDVNRLDNYPTQMDAYINDQLHVRPFLLLQFHRLKYAMRVSPNPEKVLIGGNNWLFLGMQEQAMYEGERQFEKQQLDSFYHIWKNRFDFLEEQKIASLWAIAPIKQYIYEDQIPLNKQRNFPNRTKKLERYLNQKFPGKTLYLGEKITSKKSEGQLYFQLDNHWNSLAGFYAYQAIMQQLNANGDSLSILTDNDIIREKKTINSGALSNFLGLEGSLYETFTEVKTKTKPPKELEKYGFIPPNDFPYSFLYECRYFNPTAKNKKKVLVIRDSFGEALMPFFQQTFTETMFVFDGWQYELHEEMIEKFEPDLIIFITLEAYTDHLLKYAKP